MAVTVSIYRAELERVAVDEWTGRDIRCLILDESSTYAFDATDVFVSDAVSAGAVEATWTGYARETLALSAPTFSGGWWQLLATSPDFGIIGTSAADETVGLLFFEHVTNDADSLLVAHAGIAPKVTVWDGTNPFTVTIPGTGLLRVGG